MGELGNVNANKEIEELRDILVNGLIRDFYSAECYNTIHKIISNHIVNINNSDNITRDFFSIYYELAEKATILSISRIYDKSKKYKTRCIAYLLKRLNELSSDLPSIEEPNLTIKVLKKYNLPESCCAAVKDADTSKFPKELAHHYEVLSSENKNLKDFRDKIIAHNEIFDGKIGFTWQIYDELIRFANEIIEVIVIAYFNTSIAVTRDAENKARSVEIILKKLNL